MHAINLQCNSFIFYWQTNIDTYMEHIIYAKDFKVLFVLSDMCSMYNQNPLHVCKM